MQPKRPAGDAADPVGDAAPGAPDHLLSRLRVGDRGGARCATARAAALIWVAWRLRKSGMFIPTPPRQLARLSDQLTGRRPG